MIISMDRIKETLGLITDIHTENINLKQDFLSFAARFAHKPGTVILMSGGGLDSARYHIIAAKPWLTFECFRGAISININGQVFNFTRHPFGIIKEIVNHYSLQLKQLDLAGLPEPVSAGLFGYLSYDLKNILEKLPRTSIDDLQLPHSVFFAPSMIIVQDKITGASTLCVPVLQNKGRSGRDEILDGFRKAVIAEPLKNKNFAGDATGFKSNFNKLEYIAAIKKIREYIAAGHVYQVNMSQRFEMGFNGDSYSLFKTLYRKNPAPFFSFINAGGHQIISTSPERFLKLKGGIVETRPIKGTRPRGKTQKEDHELKNNLQKSRKDDAELSMIVDLLRNDIGKVCAAGSVKVKQHKMVEAYSNVYHLVSIVEGRLDTGRDAIDLIEATFPGGSITGCPKIRAMEIIDELEPHARHIYTGSIGYISFSGSMDLSIAIRTATVYKDKIFFSAGGGIVFDSDPLDEFNETIHKGRTLMDVFKGKVTQAEPENHLWFNGRLKPVKEACVPVTDQGLLFGFGFFETIRADKGKPLYLDEHIARFNNTWENLFESRPPDLTWNSIINEVIVKNRLTDKTAAVKILATRGDRETPPFNHALMVMARPYVHRLAKKKSRGLKLLTYPEARHSPLASLKTLNYLYYLLAGKWAMKMGADEALILNPDGTVSETNTANIMLISDKKVLIPDSEHVLPGIMQKTLCGILVEWGYKIEKKVIMAEDLLAGEEVIISNSLMGAVPVLSLDNHDLPCPTDLCERINRAALCRPGIGNLSKD
jgi:para-aminobenzoate synthetase component 1